jgi:hypothetical protein
LELLQLLDRAAQEVYDLPYAVRVGLRYINQLTLDNTGSASVAELWDVLRPELTALPRSDCWDMPVEMVNNLLLAGEKDEQLTLRSGFRSAPEPTFLLDFDCYVGGVYLVCDPQIADLLDLDPSMGLETDLLSIRKTRVAGTLYRLSLTLLDEGGGSLQQEVTVFVPNLPPYEVSDLPSILGWMGCLERLRFAIDPATDTFHFGAVDPLIRAHLRVTHKTQPAVSRQKAFLLDSGLPRAMESKR